MRRLNWILAVVSLASTLGVVVLWDAWRNERQLALALQMRVQQLESQVASAPAATTSTQHAPAATASDPPPANSPGPVASNAIEIPPELRGRIHSSWDHQRRLLQDPKYHAAFMAQRRLEIDGFRQDAIRVIGMTPEQAEKVIDSIIEAEIELNNASYPGNDEGRAQRRRDIEESEHRQEAALRELLGDAQAAKWKEYMDSLEMRNQVRQLQTALASSVEPLRADQVEPLVSALHAEEKEYAQSVREFRENNRPYFAGGEVAEAQFSKRQAEMYSAVNKRAHEAAAQILTQTQLATFDRIRANQLAMLQAHAETGAARLESEVPPFGSRD